MWAPDVTIRQAMTKEMQSAYKSYNSERIRVPALAIYAAPKSAADLMRPWYAAEDPAIRERVEKLYRLQRDRVASVPQSSAGCSPADRGIRVVARQ